MSNKTFRRIAAVSLVLLAAAHLSGCGGGDSDPAPTTPPPSGNNPPPAGNNPPPAGNNPPPAAVGSATGVFLDSAVQGLRYTTAPSNISGVTNASGEFSYNPGDTVTFALGDLVIGAVPAQSRVTPLTVAEALVAANPTGDLETITVNVLAFLQSLDSDGNADNGITISTAVAGAMSASVINFVADAGAFTSSLTSLVSTVESTAGVDLTVVTREQAEAHFVGQVPNLVAGTYVFATEDGSPVTQNTRTLTLFENGSYLYGGHDSDPNCNDNGAEDQDGNGVEMGAYAFNPLTRELTFSATFQTNGSCGPETAEDAPLTLAIEDGVLHIQAEDETTYWVAVPSTADQLAGSWALPVALIADRPLVVSFFPSETAGSGRYFLVDALNEEENGDAGIEEGCYTVAENGELTTNLTASCTAAVDTNGEAGLSHPAPSAALEVDEHGRLRLFEEDITSDFVRLPLQAYTHADRAGAYYLNEGDGPMTGRNLFVVAMFDDGRYLLGGVHDSTDCDESSMTADPQDPQGNGAELGQLTSAASSLHGLVTASTPTVDTNGGCGLHNGADGAATEQSYLFTRSALDGSMIVYPYDESAGVVFTRLPSQSDGLIGAWITDGDTDHPYMTVFMPTDVMFDVSARGEDEDGEDQSGLFSWTYEVDAVAGELTLTWGGASCVDTQGDYDDCAAELESEEATFELEGDELTIQYIESDPIIYTRIQP